MVLAGAPAAELRRPYDAADPAAGFFVPQQLLTRAVALGDLAVEAPAGVDANGARCQQSQQSHYLCSLHRHAHARRRRTPSPSHAQCGCWSTCACWCSSSTC
jgi:hypothetical protein